MDILNLNSDIVNVCGCWISVCYILKVVKGKYLNWLYKLCKNC